MIATGPASGSPSPPRHDESRAATRLRRESRQLPRSSSDINPEGLTAAIVAIERAYVNGGSSTEGAAS